MMLALNVSCDISRNSRERWEGIQGNRLRVYVKYDFPVDLESKEFDKVSEYLSELGKRRAMLLLLSYTRIHVKSVNRIEKCNIQIYKAINNGELFKKKCSKVFCEAFYDFNIKDFADTASGKNSIKSNKD